MDPFEWFAEGWRWFRENWVGVYVIGGLLSGAISALVVLVWTWWIAQSKYALGGLLWGWIPGMIAGCIAFIVVGLIWPLLIFPVACFVYILPSLINEWEYSRR